MSFRRVVSLLLLAAYLPACTSFQVTSQPLAQLTAQPTPVEKVRVTTADGAQIDVNSPRVTNDTLYGSMWTAASGGKQSAGVVTIPVTDIRTVEVRKSDGSSTAMLVIGIVAAVVLLGVAFGNAYSNGVCSSGCGP